MFHEGNIFTGWLLLFTLLSSLPFIGTLQYHIINSAFGKEASVYKSSRKKKKKKKILSELASDRW